LGCLLIVTEIYSFVDKIWPFIAFISGASLWELFKYFFPDIKKIYDDRINAKKNLYKSIDPILKSSSELYGKLESLSKEDFATFINIQNSNSDDPLHNQKYVYYLFAQFWGQLEHIRIINQYNSLTTINKGKELLRFIETFESRKYRILDRSKQRIIGEILIQGGGENFRIMSINEFIMQLNKNDSSLILWIKELEDFFMSVGEVKKRQIVLRYGVLLAIFIDHFDPDHKVARRRNVYKNKLTKDSKLMVKDNLLNHYLKFTKNQNRYY
jgi:hypothetical protein